MLPRDNIVCRHYTLFIEHIFIWNIRTKKQNLAQQAVKEKRKEIIIYNKFALVQKRKKYFL